MDVKIRRISAYALDYIFLFLFLTMVSQIRFLNPTYEEYATAYDEYAEFYEDVSMSDYLEVLQSDEYQKISYDLDRYSMSITIVTIIIYLAYFVGFQKWNKNQTLGKKAFKVKVASMDGKKVRWWQYLLRFTIAYNIVLEILLLIILLVCNYQQYSIAGNILTVIASFILWVNIFCILFRKDGRGLHDLLAKTKVVDEISKESGEVN